MRKARRRAGLLLAALGWLAATPASPAEPPKSIPNPGRPPPGTCLSADEVELVRLVQEYRRANHLPPIVLSRSLSLVAQWHAADLERNPPTKRKDKRGQPCGLQSWSDWGPWTSFCYTADNLEAQKVWDKPLELTGGKYRGMGFELVYASADRALPFRALDYWTVRPEASRPLLEQSPWSTARWPAFGVGMSEHYAVLWLGTAKDPQGTIEACPPPPGGGRPDPSCVPYRIV